MKFRFLGDVDCPDWLLAEIYHLSQMAASKIKIIGNIVIKSIVEEVPDEEKVKKIAQDSKIEMEDLKAILAALEMIFFSSARNNVCSDDLNSELQQLGLPKEHSAIVTRLHTDNCAQITNILTGQSLRLSRLISIGVEPSDSPCPFAKLTIKKTTINEKDKETTTINIPKDALSGIISELKNIQSLMEQLKK